MENIPNLSPSSEISVIVSLMSSKLANLKTQGEKVNQDNIGSVIEFMDEPIHRRAPTNPMLITEVLEVLFPYLDYNSLQTSRVVCKIWTEMATIPFRKMSQIRLGTTSDPVILATIANSELVPMSKLNYRVPPCPMYPEILSFFETHGSYLTHLTLPAYRFSAQMQSDAYIQLLDNVLVTLCPNLKHLCLSYVDQLHFTSFSPPPKSSAIHSNLKSLDFTVGETYIQDGSPYYAMRIIGRVLDRSPFVQKIRSNFRYNEEILFSFLLQIKERGLHKQIIHLDMDHARLSNVHLEILNQIQFSKLKYFRIDSLLDNSVSSLFNVFMRKIAPILETLIFDGNVGNQKGFYQLRERRAAAVRIILPRMEKLKCLENRDVEGFQMGNISFLNHLPSLETLVLKEFGIWAVSRSGPWRRLIVSRDDQVCKMETIKTINMGAVFRPYPKNLISFQRTMAYFPSLRIFQTSVSLASYHEGFSSFLSTLSLLKELKVLILGFRDCMQIIEDPLAKEYFIGALKRYIPRFQKLQRLELNMEDLPTGLNFLLTFDLVSGAFCQCKPLTSLILQRFKMHPEDSEKISKLLSFSHLMNLEFK